MHSCHYGDHHIISKSDKLPLIYRNSPRELVEDCGVEAIVIPHHIGYTPGYRGINWDEFDEQISPVVEVYSNVNFRDFYTLKASLCATCIK